MPERVPVLRAKHPIKSDHRDSLNGGKGFSGSWLGVLRIGGEAGWDIICIGL
jgi:hypothetical protein